MAQLPIISGSIVETPVAGTQINPQAFREAALAPGKLAEAIGVDVGDTFQNLSNQIQEVRNSKKIWQADLAMRQTYDNFLQDIQKDPQMSQDPGTWAPEFERRAKETTNSILNQPDLAPVVKRHLNQVTALWSVNTTSEVRLNALKKDNAETIKLGDASATAYLMAGDDGLDDKGNKVRPNGIEMAAASYKQLLDNHLITQKAYDLRMMQAPKIYWKAKVDRVITSSPETAPDDIKPLLSHLPASEQKTESRAALQAQRDAWRSNYSDLAEKHRNPQTGQIPDEIIKDAMDRREIDPEVGKRELQANQRADFKGDHDRYDLITSQINNTEAMRPDPTEYAHSLMPAIAGVKDPHLKQELLNHLDARLKSVAKNESNPIVETQLKFMRQNLEDRIGDIPVIPAVPSQPKWFGLSSTDAQPAKYATSVRELEKMSDDEFKRNFGDNAKRSDLIKTAQQYIEAERLKYAKSEAAFLAWVKNPDNQKRASDPTTVQAMREYFEGKEGSDPHQDTTKEEYDAMVPNGINTYWHGGKEYIR